MSSKDIKLFEADRISRDPLDSVQIGDWYWVKYGKNDSEKEHEHLFCVKTIGSNYIGFIGSSKHGGEYTDRIHFDEFFARCRPEPNWREHLNKRMAELQDAIREKTKQLVKHGQKLFLLPQDKDPNITVSPEETHSLLPMKIADEPKKYKKALVKLQKDVLPEISKEIKELAEEFAMVAKDMCLPDLVRLGAVKEKLGAVEDRIFTIELYCGLQEEVHQIAKGNPAPASEKIAVRQAMLFMDEETLFDYKDGGMDFEKIGDFDEWVAKPENLNRVLPEQKGVVAFKVRREDKEYSRAETMLQAWTQIGWHEANKQTYLLIRNGENVYRISSEIDFSPRLIPTEGEIGIDQFKQINSRYEWSEDGGHKRIETETLVTPDDVKYDDHVRMLEHMLKQYNRIVILIQGLLDRSLVFHPHPPIKLTVPGVLDEWVLLIRDEERGLPSNVVTFEEYQKQVNTTLRKGKWVYIDKKYNEKYKDGNEPYREGGRTYGPPPRRGWAVNTMPEICQVEAMKRDGSAVQVSWPWGQRSKGKPRWVESKTRPGWGHTEYDYSTDRMCHEWVPVHRVFNVSDYNLGDYKMFLCDRTLKGKYLKWAQYVLTAEDWSRNRAKGIPPEEDKMTQVGR
jgi:hypothetical protein